MGNLFKGKSTGPQYQPSNTTTRQELPSYIENALQEQLVPGARQEAKQNRVAPFNRDQLQAFGMTRNNLGQGQEQLGRATSFFDRASTPLNQLDYKSYMNPYIQNVLNQQIRGIKEEQALNANDINSKAGMLGAYAGGGAQGLLNRNNINTQRLINDTLEKGYFNAFENAQKMGLKDFENAERAGYNQIKLGDLGREYSNEDIESLLNIGNRQQGQLQRENYSNRENLNFLLSILSGTPMETNQTQTNTPSFTKTKRSDRIGQLIGTALQAASMF